MSNCSPELALKILQVTQWLLCISNVLLASFGLADGYSQRNEDNLDEKECSCILKTRPDSCELRVVKHAKSEYDPLFLLICSWIALSCACLFILDIFHLKRSRLVSSLVLFIVGSFEVALGEDFDKWAFYLVGGLSLCFSLILLLSMMCLSSNSSDNSSKTVEDDLGRSLLEQEERERDSRNQFGRT